MRGITKEQYILHKLVRVILSQIIKYSSNQINSIIGMKLQDVRLNNNYMSKIKFRRKISGCLMLLRTLIVK